MSDEVEKKEKKPFTFGVKFVENYEKLQSNIPVLIITCVTAFVVMLFVLRFPFFAIPPDRDNLILYENFS